MSKGIAWREAQGVISQIVFVAEQALQVSSYKLTMGWFSDDHEYAQSYDECNNAPHQATLSHELIAGAASYEAAKAYENHCSENGQPGSHAEAKEIFAGFAGAYVDRVAETKGLDYVDRERAKRDAQQNCQDQLANDYQGDY